MKKLAVGILAHVDAGKTTLSEGLLYRSGSLRRLGRVDHQDAFLDTDPIERERGITIFSKQAILPLGETTITLLDTPGHVDFSSEAERTMGVLDYAILVVSGTDGVQGHTMTLWRLLKRYGVPVFLFVNKVDLAGADRAALIHDLKAKLDDGCVDVGDGTDTVWLEEAAMCDESAMEAYLESGTLSDDVLARLVAERKLFPCCFGSALKLEGVDHLLDCLDRYTRQKAIQAEFGARIFKIARDAQGNRLTYLKVTGGTLKVKDLLTNRRSGLPDEKVWEEKVDQIRIYSGEKFQAVERAEPGTVCAVTGLSQTKPGEGLGFEPPGEEPALEPVLSCQVLLPEGQDPYTAMMKLRQLEEEDPQLHLVWNEQLREIHIQLMGQIQLEVLRRLALERFGMEISFGPGSIVYRETIAAPVEGVGHYEPLRHYAEVHLLLEPLPPGSGLRFGTACPEDVLEGRWQRLILTHLEEKIHLGVLTGSPITDMSIILTAGRAHEKHTEGGDFRQATYRAVRQGLMEAQSVLLEPWYDFRLEIPGEYVGRAMSDLQRMGGRIDPPETLGTETVLTGTAPVAELGDYAREVTAYTRGQGRLNCVFRGYEPCRDQDSVVEALGYDPDRDLENPADSVFCSHGAGYVVKWDKVPEMAHVSSGIDLAPAEEAAPDPTPSVGSRRSWAGSLEEDKELQAIYERTYGKVEREAFRPAPKPARTSLDGEKYRLMEQNRGPEYLLVDGYNIIFAWEELKTVAQDNLDAARKMLMDLLSNYQGFRKCEVILVFDAYKVPGNLGEVTRYHNIYVVYTKEAETADAYIEKTTFELGKRHRVRVATSDGAEQLIILGHGALRLSATVFRQEMEQVSGQIAAVLARNNRRERSAPVRHAMDRAMEKKKR